MKTKATTWKIFLGGIVLMLAAGVLMVSLWRVMDQRVEDALVPGDGAQNVLTGEVMMADMSRNYDFPRGKYVPHQPQYLTKMAGQRVQLWLTRDPAAKSALLARYAAERMGTAQQLLEAGRGKEAVEAAAKGYLYSLAAAKQWRQLTRVERDQAGWVLGQLEENSSFLLDMREVVIDGVKPRLGQMADELIRTKRDLLEEAAK